MPDPAVAPPPLAGGGWGEGPCRRGRSPPAPLPRAAGESRSEPPRAACCAPPASASPRSTPLLLGGQRGSAGDVPVVVDRRPARPADRRGDPGRRAEPDGAVRRGRPAGAGADHRGPAGAEHRGRRDLSAGRSSRPADRRQPAALAARGGAATATGTSCRSSAPACVRSRVGAEPRTARRSPSADRAATCRCARSCARC